MKKKLAIIVYIIYIMLNGIACTYLSSDETNAYTEVDREINTMNICSILSGTYKVPLQDIYVNVPEFKKIEEGYMRIFYDEEIKYIAFTCLYEEKCEDIDTAHKKNMDTFLWYINDYHRVNSLGELEIRNVVVNEIEAYRYEGVVNAGRNPVYDAYIYGYSFVYGGFPCCILGVVKEETQPIVEKEKVRNIVDEMMKTVRNSK